MGEEFEEEGGFHVRSAKKSASLNTSTKSLPGTAFRRTNDEDYFGRRFRMPRVVFEKFLKGESSRGLFEQ